MSKTQKPSPRIRKQNARRRAESILPSSLRNSDVDSNAAEILPTSAGAREERRKKLREDLRAARPESKTSSKKRKRLDKYIDVKLKKDENIELIKKLAAQGQTDTSLLRSSKKLGRGHETKRELLGRTLRGRRSGLVGEDDEELLMEERERPTDNMLPEPGAPSSVQKTGPIATPAPTDSAVTQNGFAGPVFGGGLKRPLEVDGEGRPVIQKRKRTKLKSRGWDVQVDSLLQSRDVQLQHGRETDEEEWEGFSAEEDGGVRLVRNTDSDDSSDIESEERDMGSDSEIQGLSDSSIEEGEEDEVEEEDPLIYSERKGRLNAFKAWASSQRNETLGFHSSNALDELKTMRDSADLKSPTQSIKEDTANDDSATVARKLLEEKTAASAMPKVPEFKDSAQPIFHVPVQRSSAIEEVRLALPIVAEEQKIMEAIRANDIVFVCGSTGSGKTTQVPQFLFEAGYGSSEGPTPGMIGVTQPRRVAAVSMASRVGVELGEHQQKVSHQIRFESTVNKTTAIKFMTDGILLREIGQDFMLTKYSAIVLDEAHERSVNTDILLGILTRVVETRAVWSRKSAKYSPLKVVIMSATLETASLLENKTLFRQGLPPVVQAEGRQHPVTMHFEKRTERDYLEQAFSKISRGHKKLPQGAILVFLTGQSEIQQLSKRLKQSFASTDVGEDRSFGKFRVSAAETTVEAEDLELGKMLDSRTKLGWEDEDRDSDSDAEIQGLDDDIDEFDIGENGEDEILKVHVLSLYSQLPTEQQMRVFQPPPPGSRLIVLATNVAETSLTIPGVRYVFDCGRAKEKRYSQTTGVQSFDVNWISKASASQRAGRAGRTGPGHCYRLYSSAVYERDFAEFAEPEISRSSVEGVVLQLKSMGIPRIDTFPFPTPPDRSSLVKAERLLQNLGALDAGKVTKLGEQLSLYPLSPRLSRMLCTAAKHGVLEYATALVAALTVGDVFIPEAQLDIKEPEPLAENERWTEADNQTALERTRRRKEYNALHSQLARFDHTCDAIKLLVSLIDYEKKVSSNAFRSYTRTKALVEAGHLQQQLVHIASVHNHEVPLSPIKGLPDPTKTQIKLLRLVIASGYVDQIAQRADLSPTPPTSDQGRCFKPKRATDTPYITLFPSSDLRVAHLDDSAADMEDPENKARKAYVFIHPESILARRHATQPDKLPQYIVYSHLSKPALSTISSTRLRRTRLHPLTPVSAEQIVALTSQTPLLSQSKPVGRIETLSRDEGGRERRAVWTVPCLVPGELSGGEMGWPMPPARKIVQRRDGVRGWVEEVQPA